LQAKRSEDGSSKPYLRYSASWASPLIDSRYPYVATEVLCSEIWSIVETCVNSSDQLLTPFWETVLDKSPEEMKTEMVMASHFAKINAVFLTKKPAEVNAYLFTTVL
jgi:hypothetical protein